jgi:alpha-N-acetylglucosaminidase
MRRAQLNRTGALYRELLLDLDALLATDAAWMLGPWLAKARRLGGGDVDCVGTVVGDDVLGGSCADFMEWNARSQLTTWKPTAKGAAATGKPDDYARKHWQGLVSDYYAARVGQYLEQALADAAAGAPFDKGAMVRREVRLAYEWQVDVGDGKYPLEAEGDPVEVSNALIAKWGRFFSACA